MLLRLLPTPSPAQPAPPTILFTLPLPSSPYTSRALPLPPNLLAHRSLCLQEDIDCANVLLGDKASWISGVVDNVTFSLPHSSIVVHLVDGSTVNVDLTDDCVALLHRVVNEVQLSFAAAAAPPAPTPSSQADSPRSSVSSDRSSLSAYSQPSSTTSTSRTSSLLYSIFQPLLPTPAPAQPPAHVAVHMQPARAHRRLARSLLVDAYRRHVLPCLKARLPSAYLLWAIQTETTSKMDEFNGLKTSINKALMSSGLDISAIEDRVARPSSTGSSPTSYSPISTRSSSPRSSIDGDAMSPQSLLADIPPAYALPAKQRVAYSAQVTRITQVATRIGSITKLASRYEREEGKRKWLEQLDLNRDGDKAIRRAFSNGLLPATVSCSSVPVRSSGLRISVTAMELEVRTSCQAAASATAALEDILEAASDEDDMSEPDLSDSRSSVSASPEPLPRTPTSDRASVFSDDEDLPLSPTPCSRKSFEDSSMLMSDDNDDDWEDNRLGMDNVSRTPPLSFDGKKRVPLPPLPAQPQWGI